MRISVAPRLSVEPSAEWVADPLDPAVTEQIGIYLRSVEHGVYLNVRSEERGARQLTLEGLLEVLRAQNWASAPFNEWTITAPPLLLVGGTFEAVGMGGEVVLEVYATDGRSLANLAGPGERAVIVAATPSVQRLVRTIRFD